MSLCEGGFRGLSVSISLSLSTDHILGEQENKGNRDKRNSKHHRYPVTHHYHFKIGEKSAKKKQVIKNGQGICQHKAVYGI